MGKKKGGGGRGQGGGGGEAGAPGPEPAPGQGRAANPRPQARGIIGPAPANFQGGPEFPPLDQAAGRGGPRQPFPPLGQAEGGGRGRGPGGRGGRGGAPGPAPGRGGRGAGPPGFGQGHGGAGQGPNLPIPAAQPATAAAAPQRSTVAPQTPASGPAYAESQAGPSTSAVQAQMGPASGVQGLSQQVAQMQVQSSAPPMSTYGTDIPVRPDAGGVQGKKMVLRANHFKMAVAQRDLRHYDISIKPPVTSKAVNRLVISALVETYKESQLGGRLLAFDGEKNVYTAGPLPNDRSTYKVTLKDDGKRKDRTFDVTVNLVAEHSGSFEQLMMFVEGRVRDIPQQVLNMYDVVLRQMPTLRYIPVGRSFFSTELGNKTFLGSGVEAYRGFYQSVRPVKNGFSLNVDMSSTAFMQEVDILAFVSKSLRRTDQTLNKVVPDRDRLMLKKALKGYRVEYTHPKLKGRRYRVNSISEKPMSQCKFNMTMAGTSVEESVIAYYQKNYQIELKYTQLPCLDAGAPGNPRYLPMELLKLPGGQRYMKKLDAAQTDNMLKAAALPPQGRQREVEQIVQRNNYAGDEFAKEFGLSVQNQMTQVNARLLPPPVLGYRNPNNSLSSLQPREGAWNMRSLKVLQGGRVGKWACVNFEQRCQYGAVEYFCAELANKARDTGLDMGPIDMQTCFKQGNPFKLEAVFSQLKALGPLGFVLCILPDNNGNLYGDIKRVCETDIGIVTQCCLQKHVYKCNPQYLANLALKINVKVGGGNTVLNSILTKQLRILSNDTSPTIVFGADVTHGSPGESVPSIAAVVGSQDFPFTCRYRGLVSAQASREEVIQNLTDMTKELMMSYYAKNRIQPQRIIFYRDGVSESQFQKIRDSEIRAIKQACYALSPDYHPKLTFVVVQKRHHTRIFPVNAHDGDRKGNIMPGTVVDTGICHPSEFDFYLCSHAGIQGTSRPTHYHVLFDENRFTSDSLQTLTNDLCYTYARCTRSVSIVPPAYYAHLLAFRARYYLGASDSSGSESSQRAGPPGSQSSRTTFGPSVPPLPSLKPEVQNVMYYC
eukprot:jgi/Mesen1/6669/ME000342S05758